MSNCRDITSGWQTEVYAFSLETDSEHRDLVLRLYPGNNAAEKARREYDGMSQLHRAGFPVPAMIAVETDTNWFGKPFIIMDWVAGKTLQQRLEAAPPSEQEPRLRQFCALFARLHHLDWRPFAPNPAQPMNMKTR